MGIPSQAARREEDRLSKIYTFHSRLTPLGLQTHGGITLYS